MFTNFICCPGLLVPSHVVITQNGVCPKPILGSALSPAVGICVNSESSTTCSPTVGGTLIRYEPPQYRHRPRQCHTRSGLWSAEGDGHVISRCHRSSFLSAESSQPTPHHRPDPSKRRNDETTRRRDDVTTREWLRKGRRQPSYCTPSASYHSPTRSGI